MILKNELPEILIYHKKKYIILGAMLLFLAVLAVSLGLTLGIAASAGEDPAEVAQDMFQVQNAVYLLPGLAVLGVPALLVYTAVHIGERRFLRVYEKMPQEAKRELYERRAQEKHPGGLMIYEAQGYILFSDRCFFGTPQIVELKDIVWGYIGHSDFQYSNMEKNVISPGLHFFSLYFHTKDGRRHRIYVHVSCDEAVRWFTGHCPKAILGYGKEQKRQAEELFRREAQQAAFLTGEEKDSYLRRKKRAVCAAAGGGLFVVLFLLMSVYIRQYCSSDAYLYRKNMKEAERYYEQGEWSRAYQAYSTAREHSVEDEEALKGMLLSRLGMAKTDGYLDSVIQNYENLFFYQDLFTDERDISGWYFECVEYYLRYDDPMGAVELLEKGMESFSREETVVGNGEDSGGSDQKEHSFSGKDQKEDSASQGAEDTQGIRRDILQRMQNKKEDILARCRIESVIEYLDGERKRYTEYDEKGQEILNVLYFYGKSRWVYNSYDKNGNVILVETWEQKAGEEEKQQIREEQREYDDRGNLLYKAEYDPVLGKNVYEVNCGYDEEGHQIYYTEAYDGEVFTERECCLITDNMQIDKEYRADYLPGKDPVYYIAQKWDEEGNLLEETHYTLFWSPEKILAGEARAMIRFDYTYDANGNAVAFSYVSGNKGESYPVYEREYDDRNNLIKEIYYDRNDEEENCFQVMTLWDYNEENLPVKEEKSTRNGNDTWSNYTTEYTYDEAGNPIREDYLNGDGEGFSVIREYDVLGNQVREYKTEDMMQEAGEEIKLDKEWEYQYHYGNENAEWQH